MTFEEKQVVNSIKRQQKVLVVRVWILLLADSKLLVLVGKSLWSVACKSQTNEVASKVGAWML